MIYKFFNNIRISKTAKITDGVYLYGPVFIGSYAFVSHNCIIGHPWSDKNIEFDMLNHRVNKPQSAMNKKKRSTIISQGVWLLPNCVICSGAKIGSGTWCDVGCFVGERSILGNDVWLHYGSRIYNDVVIGPRSNIGGFVCNRSTIGKNVTMFGALIHRLDKGFRRINNKTIDDELSPIICDDVTIGWGALIIGGIKIGKGAQIGALSIVTKDVCAKEKIFSGEKI